MSYSGVFHHQTQDLCGKNKVTRFLVEGWLFSIQIFPYSVSFWCMLRIDVEVLQRTFYIGTVVVKLILAPLSMPK